MKQILRPKYLPFLVLFCSLLGYFLQLRILGNGPDSEGLYALQPLAWVFLAVLTAMLLVLIRVTCGRLKINGSFADNFPASVPATVGCCVGLLGIASSALQALAAGDILSTATAILGAAATVAMVNVAVSRYKGHPAFFLSHAAISLYWGLQVFLHCKNWGNESQIGVFLVPFLALIFLMLASYHYATFDVDLGNRKSCLFWSLGGAYLCIVAMADKAELLIFGTQAVWLLTNLCALNSLKKPRPDDADEPTGEEAEATPDTRTMTMEEISLHMDLK